MKTELLTIIILCGTLQVFGENDLSDLKSLDDLQKQFTADTGRVRLIALLSPT